MSDNEDRESYRKAVEQRLHQAVAALDAVSDKATRTTTASSTYNVLHYNMFVESTPAETILYLQKEIVQLRSMLKEV